MKILVRLGLGLVAVLVILVGIAFYQLDSIVAKGINEYGDDVVKTDMGVESVSISPFSGTADLKGFYINQPQGFGDSAMIAVDRFSTALRPRTVFSDHIIFDSMTVATPQLSLLRQGGETNFQAFQKALGPTDESEPATITLTIKTLTIETPKLDVKLDAPVAVDKTVTLESFTLTDLGTDEKGLAPREIARHVMDALQPQIARALVEMGVRDKVEGKLKDEVKGLREKMEGKLEGAIGKLKNKGRLPGSEKDDGGGN